MHPENHRAFDPNGYRKSTEASRRIAWDIDNDVFRGRRFDFSTFLLPDGLSKLSELEFLGDGDHIDLVQTPVQRLLRGVEEPD